jgi:5-methyltetrahydrofolate--homocysteine methyltransferase
MSSRPTASARRASFWPSTTLQDRTRELNLAAARLAREVADEYSTPEQPRFVAGSIGPTTKLPSLGHIGYDAMAAAYREQAEALIEGGVDVLLIETCQDLLQAKIALAACQDAIRDAREGRIPRPAATLPSRSRSPSKPPEPCCWARRSARPWPCLRAFQPDVLGLNCATGPAEMNDAVRFLCQNSTLPISVQPNAGLPQNEGGHAVYKLTPAELASWLGASSPSTACRSSAAAAAPRPSICAPSSRPSRVSHPPPRSVKPQSVAASAFSAVLARSRRAAHRHCRGDEHHHAPRNLSQHGARRRLRRHSPWPSGWSGEGSQMLDLCCAIVGEDEQAT